MSIQRIDYGQTLFSDVVATSAPASEPVTVSDFKSHARIDASFTDDDTLIANYIQAARERLEDFFNRSFTVVKGWTAWASSVGQKVYVPRPPIISITTVTAYDSDFSETVLTSDDYNTIGTDNLIIVLESWDYEALKIEYSAGHATVPELERLAVLQAAAAWYENAGDVGKIPESVKMNLKELDNRVKIL